MCEPVSISMAVVAIAGTLQQRQQAKAGNKAAKVQQQIETKRARQEAMDRNNQLSQDALVESTRLNKERTELALETLREDAAIAVGSAESGLGGVSKVRSFLTADVQGDLARSDIDTNARNAQFNLAQASRGIESTQFARRQNAFLTRQAQTQKVPGALEFGMAVLPAAGSAATGLMSSSAAASTVPTFSSGQVVGKTTALNSAKGTQFQSL